MKLTFQITGSVALFLWAVILFIPGASRGTASLLTQMGWWLAGRHNPGTFPPFEFLVSTLILVGYAIFAFRAAARREQG